MHDFELYLNRPSRLSDQVMQSEDYDDVAFAIGILC
jgi:hypothetical protein